MAKVEPVMCATTVKKKKKAASSDISANAAGTQKAGNIQVLQFGDGWLQKIMRHVR